MVRDTAPYPFSPPVQHAVRIKTPGGQEMVRKETLSNYRVYARQYTTWSGMKHHMVRNENTTWSGKKHHIVRNEHYMVRNETTHGQE
jgi:hypothetical protein